MTRKRMRSLLAVAGCAVALIVLQVPALGAPVAGTPTISLAAKSAKPKVTGDVWVVWQASKLRVATLSGTVSGGTAGQVIKIFARKFPYKKRATQLGAAIPVTGTTTTYAMRVTPGLATRYKAEVFANATATSPIAKSPVSTVYVVQAVTFHGGGPCRQRPVCHKTLRVTVKVPPSALGTERPKPWYVYFGLNLSRTGEPKPPKYLKLGAGRPKVSSVRKVSASELALTISVSFRIGNDGYYWSLNACTKDTEATDGLNLPGHHGCGTAKRITRTRVYLG